jgi:calpain-7
VAHLSWNPELFKFHQTLHFPWMSSQNLLPTDKYCVADNPQFLLEVENTGESFNPVWVLLTTHVRKTSEKSQNFVALHQFKTPSPIFPKIFYHDQSRISTGTYINTPHYLHKMDTPPRSSILLVSQLDKLHDMYFTIDVHSAVKVKLTQITSNFRYEKKLNGEWTSTTAGGPTSTNTYGQNPQFRLELDSEIVGLCIKLYSFEEYSVNLSLCHSGKPIRTFLTTDRVYESSGDYRKHFCYLQCENIPAGAYNIVVSTFHPAQLGGFLLQVMSTSQFSIQPQDSV